MIASIVLTTHERPDALERVLDALSRQPGDRFEVLVADDGSGSATDAVLARWQGRVGRRLDRFWQPHEGFRAARCRNGAVRLARGDYLVFLDGDCIAPGDFVEAHGSLAAPRRFVAGNRMLLSADYTAQVLRDDQAFDALLAAGPIALAAARRAGRVNRLLPALRLPLGPLRDCEPARWRGAKTCNLGLWRADFEAVDGFDERYRGWGYEDSDLVVRLIRSGVSRRDGRWATGVFHLWHPPARRDEEQANRDRLDALLHETRTTALQGLSRHAVRAPDRKAS